MVLLVGIMKDRSRIVDNNAIDEIAGALAQAHQVQDLPDSQILMVADHDDGNLYDQQVHSIFTTYIPTCP